jgi:SAM-dependent methyltransferase
MDVPARDTAVTPELVRQAYQFFLGREPESAEVVEAALSYGTFHTLRRAFIEGAEFRGLLPSRPALIPLDAPPLLVEAFGQVIAADVSASHLDLARKHVAGSMAGNVRFVLVEDGSFGMTGGYDLWFSRLVLQHNPPPVIAMIMRQALACLAPGGVAVFQVPTYAAGYSFGLAAYLRGLPAAGEIEMHVLPQPIVFGIVRQAECDVVEVLTDTAAGNPLTWTSNTFVVRKGR